MRLDDVEDDSLDDSFKWYLQVDCSDYSLCFPTALTAHESEEDYLYLGTTTQHGDDDYTAA